MSEFSASYHLRTKKKDDVVNLIKNSGNKGYVFEETNGWVSFVIKGLAFDIDDSLISCNPGIIVHYIYAEDHGWELRIFNKDDLVFEYKCDWTDEIHIEKELFDIDLIKELVIAQGNSVKDLESLFDITDYDFEEPAAYEFAEKIGLTNYEWVSADYFDDNEVDERVLVVD